VVKISGAIDLELSCKWYDLLNEASQKKKYTRLSYPGIWN